MTDSAKQAWGEVGDRFSPWGRRVADRYQSKGVSAVGGTLKDDQAKKELSDAVSALGDAITATVNEATEAIRSKGSSPPPPPPPPPSDS